MLKVPRFHSFIDNDGVSRNNIQHVFILLRFFLSLFFAGAPFIVYAQGSDNVREQLSRTTDEIKEVSKREKQISEENTRLQRELKVLQREIVSLANAAGEHEEDLSTVEEKLDILEDQKLEKNKALAARQAELSMLISAMVRLKQFPPEAVIAMPGKLNETLATARALNILTRTIEEESGSLRSQLRELEDLEKKIKKNHAVVTSKQTDLETRRAELAKKIEERTVLLGELGSEDEKEKARLAQLRAKSQNLQDLVDALGKPEQKPQSDEQESIRSNSVRNNEKGNEEYDMRSFVDAKGKMHMPAVGKIIRHYNGGGDDNAFSRGITIETRENSSVVAPYDGEVVYAGVFRDYGRIVIIRHSDDYHTLLSGMEHINCAPGQFLMEGEPIGTMGKSRDARRLYMEVRKNSKPIDPSPWLRASS